MDYFYKGENLHDLVTHREFNRSYANGTPHLVALNLCVSILLIGHVHQFNLPSSVYSFLFIAAIYLVSFLSSNSKKGDIHYRRILQSNNGLPRHELLTFTQDGIHMINANNGNHLDFSYDQFRRVIESKNLLILIMKHRSCLILHKNRLEGGSVQDLFAFLKERCVNLKGKHPRKTAFGQWVRRLLTLIIITGSIWALLNLPFFSVMDHLLGRLDNSMSYEQMAEVLSDLEIVISQRAIDEMKQYDADYFDENGEDFYDGAFRNQKVSDLLYWEASGFYNEIKDEWQHSTSGVLWQDYYLEELSNVYPDFFAGLSAMDEALTFSNVQVDLTEEILDDGYDTTDISFLWQENNYTLEIAYTDCSIDMSIIPQIAQIVNSTDQKLYICTDRSDGIFIYYGSSEQVNNLERCTNLHFKDAARPVWWTL